MNGATNVVLIKQVGRWRLEELIGKGAQATVYKARNTESNDVAAIKEIVLDQVEQSVLTAVRAEVDLIKEFKHPFVICLKDHFLFEKNYYLVYDYVERGSLYKAIKSGVFSMEKTIRVIREVLLGLNYVHRKGIIHRDIKADNILIDKSDNIKIADFGISVLVTSKNKNADIGELGSPYWMAPEVIQMQPPTTKSDIWSVGCLTLELLTGKPPYFDLTAMSALYHICEDPEIRIEDPYHSITPNCHSFLMECFQKDPKKRKSADELLKHPWFNLDNMRKESKIPLSKLANGLKKEKTKADSRSETDSHSSESSLKAHTHHLSKDSLGFFEELDLQEMVDDLTSTPPIKAFSSPQPALKLRRVPSTVEPTHEMDQNMIESEIVMHIGILSEATRKKNVAIATLINSLNELYQYFTKYPNSYHVLVDNNGLYPLLTTIRMNVKNEEVCLQALKIVYYIMTSDPQTHLPMLLMGILSSVTHFISTGFESSSVLISGKQTASARNEVKDRIMDLCVKILMLFSEGQGTILDIFFTSGLINCAVQLLDSSRLRYVESGITCLINIYNSISSISSSVVIDILFSMGIIRFLFSGLIFCISINTNKSFIVASQLLEFILLYTKQNKTDYVDAIIKNSALNSIVVALATDPVSLTGNNTGISAELDEYKIRVLRLMKSLQSVHHHLFDHNVLSFLLPLLLSRNVKLVDIDMDLILNLMQLDSSQKILTEALHSDMVRTLLSLLKTSNEVISDKAIRLIVLVGKSSLSESPHRQVILEYFQNTRCFDVLLGSISNAALCSDILNLLTQFGIVDNEYLERLVLQPKYLSLLITCYEQNSQNKNDNNVYAIMKFIHTLPGILNKLSEQDQFVRRIVLNIRSGNQVNQGLSAKLLYAICKASKRKQKLNELFGILQVVKSARDVDQQIVSLFEKLFVSYFCLIETNKSAIAIKIHLRQSESQPADVHA